MSAQLSEGSLVRGSTCPRFQLSYRHRVRARAKVWVRVRIRARVRVRVRFSVKFRNLHYYILDKWTLGQVDPRTADYEPSQEPYSWLMFMNKLERWFALSSWSRWWCDTIAAEHGEDSTREMKNSILFHIWRDFCKKITNFTKFTPSFNATSMVIPLKFLQWCRPAIAKGRCGIGLGS